MKRSYIAIRLLAVSAVTSPVYSADFDDSIPTAVAEQLIGSIYGGEARLSAGILAGFPPFDMPQGMSVLASLDQGYTQRVILTSRFDHQAASALAYAALLNSGWQLVANVGMQQPQTGFISPNQPVGQTQLCHDQYGIMMVSTTGGLDATYVHMTRNVTPPGAPPQITDCATGATMPQQMVMRDPGPTYQLVQYVPRLVLPNSEGMSAPLGGYGGGGGAPNEWEVRATLNGSWDMKRVFNYFADQMVDQDWKRDTSAIGDQMASGSWTKSAEGDMELTGSLTVLATGEDSYDLRFRMLRIGGPDNTAPGGFGVRGPLGIQGIPAGVRAVPIGGSANFRER